MFPRYCDKSISYIRNGVRVRGSGTGYEVGYRVRGTGTRYEDPVQGTRRPTTCVNSVIIQGNEDPPCVHMGGKSDPLSRCVN